MHKNWNHPDHLLQQHFYLWEVVLHSACGVSTSGYARYVIAVKLFFLCLVLIYLIRQ